MAVVFAHDADKERIAAELPWRARNRCSVLTEAGTEIAGLLSVAEHAVIAIDVGCTLHTFPRRCLAFRPRRHRAMPVVEAFNTGVEGFVTLRGRRKTIRRVNIACSGPAVQGRVTKIHAVTKKIVPKRRNTALGVIMNVLAVAKKIASARAAEVGLLIAILVGNAGASRLRFRANGQRNNPPQP